MFAPLPDETLTENIPPTKWRKTGAAARLTWEVGRAILVSSKQRAGRLSENLEGGFFAAQIVKEAGSMEEKSLCRRLRTAYWSLVAVGCGLLLSVRPVLAETIWDRFSSIMQDIYGQVVAISTIVAVTVAAIALIVRMVSRNQRAVDEATSWLKRIVVTWIVLNTLGFIVAYLQPLIAGGQYTGG